ncbi:MAG: RsmD family RNA methyltransferase [Polyangiales bacterium]
MDDPGGDIAAGREGALGRRGDGARSRSSPPGPRSGTGAGRVCTSSWNKALGYLPRRGRGVTDIAACVVLADPIAAAMDRVRADVLPGLVGQGEVNLPWRRGQTPRGHRVGEPQPPGVYSTLEAMVKSGVCVGATLRAGGASEPARWGDTDEVAPDDQLAIRGPFPGFSQANDAVNARLREVVAEWAAAEGAHVLELYAGHGNLTLALAPGAASVRAVEMSEEAARFGTANARAAGFDHVTFIPGDVAKHIKGPADIVVLDPPRTGAKDVMAAILALRPRRIVYVSCDVATLGRDLATLREGGYAPTRARAFDMFPQTAHVESVVLAEPVGGG